MITKIKISGYKSIKEQKVLLNPINIFIGGNGVGKSNFVSVFSLVRAVNERNLSAYVIKKGGANKLLHFGKKNTQNIKIDLTWGAEEADINQYSLSLEEAQDALFIQSVDTAFYYNDRWFEQNYESNVKESSFREIKEGQAFFVNNRLNEFGVYHFHDTSDSSPMKAYSDVNDNRYLKPNGSNIASFLYYLKETHYKNYLRIEKTITSVAPFFERFNLEPSQINPKNIQLEWLEKGNYEAYFDANNLSDGTLRFICLATLLMQPNPPQTIIIDEPELGLHPVAINKLAVLVRKASKDSQLIISTQSVNLIDNFEPEDIVVADRKGSETIFNRLDKNQLQEWLDLYTLGDIWGKNIIGGQPFSVPQ